MSCQSENFNVCWRWQRWAANCFTWQNGGCSVVAAERLHSDGEAPSQDANARRPDAAFNLQPDHKTQTLASTHETETPERDLLTLKGAQEKEKTASELQWNWLELQCRLIKTVHRLIPQCALTGLRKKWAEVQSGDETTAVTESLLSRLTVDLLGNHRFRLHTPWGEKTHALKVSNVFSLVF